MPDENARSIPADVIPPIDDEPALYRVTLWLCGPCMTAAGGECHSPGCSLWMNRAPDLPITHDADGKPVRLRDEDAQRVRDFNQECLRALADATGGA